MEIRELKVKGLYGIVIRDTGIHFTFDSIHFNRVAATFLMKCMTIAFLFKDADIEEARQAWRKFNENT